MALIALPFILVMPSRQRRAGGGGEKEAGQERVKLEGGREIARPWFFSTASKKAACPPRGTIKGLW